MRSSWVKVGPTSNDKRLDRTIGRKNTQRRRPCENRGRGWNYGDINQGSLELLRVGRDKKGFFPRDFGVSMALWTP